jgi:hypothetical protein
MSAVFGGVHLSTLGGNFAAGHISGLAGQHFGGFGGTHIGGVSVDPMGMLGHTRVSNELGYHHFRGLYGVSPLYDGNDCPWPAGLMVKSCPVGSDTE